MAPYSGTVAWKIPWTEPSRLQSMGSQRVGHTAEQLHFHFLSPKVRGLLGGSAEKNLPAMQETQETQVWSLGQEDPLEEGMATHSNILAWKIPMDQGAQQATAHRVANSWTQLKWLSTHAHTKSYLSSEPIIHSRLNSNIKQINK